MNFIDLFKEPVFCLIDFFVIVFLVKSWSMSMLLFPYM